ncbi:hypothetical protein EDD85DRAFT_796471 [Armillaria nabsnona]|nr:hypothetical protein EDD85DRAFT_796471 [Armillaria nabsnona]
MGCYHGLDVGGIGKTGGGDAGVIFTMMEMVRRETVLTTGFPDVENRGGEVLAAVDRRVSGSLAHIRFVFPHPENGGYTNLGWLGGLKGMQEPIVGFWQGGGQWSYRDGYGCNHCALESSFDA